MMSAPRASMRKCAPKRATRKMESSQESERASERERERDLHDRKFATFSQNVLLRFAYP